MIALSMPTFRYQLAFGKFALMLKPSNFADKGHPLDEEHDRDQDYKVCVKRKGPPPYSNHAGFTTNK
jgi:hypothetical protein